MDSAFWQAIKDADFAVSEGHTVADLTPELLSSLGAVDPTVREGPAYDVLEDWVHRGVYSDDELRAIAAQMLRNLQVGVGEPEGDAVFLRTFSLLILNEIIDEDNRRPFLRETEIREWMEEGLAYLAAERDLRGRVPGKGWAHAVAHAADFLTVLARNRFLGRAEMERILIAIERRLSDSQGYAFLYEEDERLAYAVMSLLRRELLDLVFFTGWLVMLAHPDGRSWSIEDLYSEEGAARYHNVKLFLRSLYFQFRLSVNPPKPAPELQPLLEDALRSMDRGYYELP